MNINEGYREFNEWVYEKFFKPILNSYSLNIASILIDIQSIENNRSFEDACCFLRDNDWNRICYIPPNGIPLFLGVIAIQVFAASQRNDDEQWTAKAYNPRLGEILKIADSNELQIKYRRAQELIYQNFEKWCKDNHWAIFLTKNSEHFRYVQYPLSLALLHKKDLESLGVFFLKCQLSPNDEIDFELFSKIFNSNLNKLPDGVKKKYQVDDKDRSEAIKKQIYSAYLNWDGRCEEKDKKHYYSQRIFSKNFAIYWDHAEPDAPEIYCNGEKANLPNPRGCFFVQDSQIETDWYFVSDKKIKLDMNANYLFIFETETDFSEKLTAEVKSIDASFDNLKIICLFPQDIEKIINLFPCRFPQEPQLRLEGGIKLDFRTWMLGTGPIIIADKFFTKAQLTKFSGRESKTEIINITPTALIDLPEGRYFLRYSPDQPGISFKILMIDFDIKSDFLDLGWSVDEMGYHSVKDHAIVNGLNFSNVPREYLVRRGTKIGNVNRLWIDLVNGNYVEKYDNENIVHCILRRNTDGICNR